MKKKFLAVALCVCLGMSVFGCSKGSDSEKDSEETTTSGSDESAASEPAYTEEDLVDDTGAELNVLDYVELAAYTGLDLTKEVTEVTDEDVQSQMEDEAVELISDDAVVADGDITVIDFTGKLDGVAFDGGTGSDYQLEIGSNSFIDGFEDGLIGVKKGDTVDLNLTFPETYKNNEELAGKDVVFTVTVKNIKRKPAELTDEWFSSNTKYGTVEEYRAETRKLLEESADSDAQYNLEEAALDSVVSNSNVKKYFKSLIEDGEGQYENYINTYATYYGMDFSEFLEAQGMSETDYENTKSKQGAAYAEVAMVVNAIAEDAGLSPEDEEYKTILSDLASQYNMDADTFQSAYGESVVRMSVMSEYVMGYITSNSNVTTKTVSAEE